MASIRATELTALLKISNGTAYNILRANEPTKSKYYQKVMQIDSNKFWSFLNSPKGLKYKKRLNSDQLKELEIYAKEERNELTSCEALEQLDTLNQTLTFI